MLIPPDSGKRKGTRPGWQGGRYAWMRRVLATDLGEGSTKRLKQTIEPIFGHTKLNRGMDRFQQTRQVGRPGRMAPDHRHPQPDKLWRHTTAPATA